ncbi:MAG TPA: adenosylcobalamin-dependent ribonucleoside-diphosphate reductase [Candidatus Saccharicenans sp.]|nr:adenosylcobalamin-dependent ribonucleoside-diphosphate reductase [Candidatus Saccharicenans sp.]HUM79787.1 adenosylcobalamin-dependent ribonucleoside-diphosphate reductase [Candidatus Saccharicenans sp.]
MVSVKDEGFSPNAMKILRTRYFMKNERGEFIDKKPSDLFRRVANYIASAEKTKEEQKEWADKFFEAMMARDFMPNSPTLTGAGRDMCLSACFVLPIEDSMESIFDAVKNAALVHKEGGGTGFDFSLLRPKGSFVRKTQGVASGPVSFLKVIDAATEAVKQGGTRRGANIGLLRVDHPDIEEFITMKRDGKTLNNFNISVAITDDFMKALKHDGEYWLYNPYLKKKTTKRKARDIFQLIVESAWAVGDPGLIFIDRINQLNPTRELGPISATNPCGEQPLHPYESCNLGSINISNFYSPDYPDEIDWERLASTIEIAVRFLDNVIDVNKYPLPQIAEMTRANRRIGLGLMGWADLLLKKKIRYDSPAALTLAEKVISFIRQTADRESEKLGELKGNFPNIDLSIYKGKKRRNATVLTIAPTGTISRLAGCSSSIEPIFAFEFVSKILDGEIKDVHPLYEEWKKEYPDEPLPDYFVTAHDIPYEGHIRMQAAFQKYVDNSVSKTINLPNQATFEDVEKAYLLAYDLGTKGITIYRDGSKAEQVLYAGTIAKQKLIPRERPVSLPSITDKIKTGLGNLYVTITFLNNKPFEVFTSIGKSGYSTMADAEAIGRLISLALRSGVDPKEVILQLKGIGGSEPVFTEGGLVQSIPDAVAKVLERHLGEVKENKRDFLKDTCPLCGATLPDEKCPVCPNCGWTRCS